MGFSVRTKQQNPPEDDEHLRALTRKILEVKSKLAQVVIRRHQGRGGFTDTEYAIDVIPEKVDEKKLDADELARTALELADRHAAENGGARYQIRGLGEDKNNELTVRLFDHSVPRGESWATADAARARDNELLAGAELHRKIAQDSHKRFMEVSGELLSMATVVRKLSTEQSTDPAKLLKVAFKIRKTELEHEADVASSKEWHGHARRVVDIVGPDIASVIGDLFRQYTGMSTEARTGPFGSRLSAILGELDEGQRARVAEAFGSDAWSILERAAKAGDDAEFRALGQKLREVWEAEGEKAVTERMKKVAAILGPKIVGVLQLLKDAGIVD